MPAARSRLVLSAPGLRQLDLRMAASLAAWGEELEAIARQDAPVLTGRLRDSMFVNVYLDGVRVHGNGPDPGDLRGRGVEVVAGNAAGYGRWVHDGTSDTPPHPFLESALAIMAPRLPQYLGSTR